MPVPRPLLLVLVGAVLLAGAFFASRGLSGTSADSDSSSAAVEPAPEPADGAPKPTQTKAPATTNPREALRGAKPVTSGTFQLTLAGKGLDLSATGSFQSQGLSEMPHLRIDLKGESAGRNIDVGAISTGKRAYLRRGEETVVLQAKGWDVLTSARAQQARNGPTTVQLQGYTKTELDSLKFQGRDTIDGTPVLHFRGPTDRGEDRDFFGGMADTFQRTSLDSPLPRRLSRSVQGGTGDVWVGAEDHVVRRIRARYRSGAGPFEIDFSRANINEPQKITAPTGASTKTPTAAGWDRASFGFAFSALTVGVFTVEPAENDAATPATPNRKQAKPDRKPVRQVRATPAAVERAVGGSNVVVLFFRQRGADDDAVATSLKSVRGRGGVSVFTIGVGQAPKYTEVGGADVVRAPTVVVIGRDDSPRLYEGFIDATTLVQAVTDAR